METKYNQLMTLCDLWLGNTGHSNSSFSQEVQFSVHDNLMSSFSITVVTNYRTLSGIKQHKLSMFWFSKSAVLQKSHQTKESKLSTDCILSRDSKGDFISCSLGLQQNLVLYDGRTKVLIFLLLVMEAHSQLLETTTFLVSWPPSSIFKARSGS